MCFVQGIYDVCVCVCASFIWLATGWRGVILLIKYLFLEKKNYLQASKNIVTQILSEYKNSPINNLATVEKSQSNEFPKKLPSRALEKLRINISPFCSGVFSYLCFTKSGTAETQ